MPKDLREATALIEELTNYERMSHGCIHYNTTDFNLQAFRDWLGDLGHPEFAAKTVFHVAGTKGKGSVSAMLATGLHEAGICTGLFTSPHLTRLTERICVDLKEIDSDSFCHLTGELIRDLSRRMNDDHNKNVGMRTTFELLTAMGFCYFRGCQCSSVVIEVGLGGRLDASNVFLSPNQKLINVIMPIGPEHRGILGNTVEQIAEEKAAVIQSHTHSVILAKQAVQYEAAVRDAVLERMYKVACHAPLIEVAKLNPPQRKENSSNTCWEITFGGSTFDIENQLVGEHQAWNLLTALVALHQAYPNFDIVKTAHAISRTQWSGRFECVSTSPVPVIIDSAHCILSTQAMTQAWMQCYPTQKPVIVCGFMADKEIAAIAQIVLRGLHPERIFACSVGNPRSAPVSAIAEQFREQDSRVIVEECNTVQDAVQGALATERPVLIFGSVMLVEPARVAWSEWRRTHE